MSPFRKKINTLILNAWRDPVTNEFYILSPEEISKISSSQRACYFSELLDHENFMKCGVKKYAEWYNAKVGKLESKKKDSLEYYVEFSGYSSELLEAIMDDASIDAVKKSVAAKILKERGRTEKIKSCSKLLK